MEDWSIENFGFAFNDSAFSDRILHIEIRPDPPPPSDDDSDSCVGIQVKTLQISSPILAAKSPFFYKLFKNGMIESQRMVVTLRIHSSEESALMDLLNFIYNNTLSATTCSDLLDVLMAADKFGVTCCMKYCIQLLLKMPMSLESALLYLELPLTALVVQPLIDASKEYLAARYRDFNESVYEEAMKLPLCAVEMVLGSEGLQVDSEDDVFGFILEWGREHYPNLNERREILTTRLVKFICFQYMSYSELKDVLVCAEFNSEQVSKLVIEALFLKAEAPYGQHIHALKGQTTTKTNFPRRIYNQRLVQVLQLEYHLPRCAVYFHLTKEECRNLFPSGMLMSESFLLGGQWFYLVAECCKNEDGIKSFGLYVHVIEGSYTLDMDLAVMKKPLKEFECQDNGKNCTLGENYGHGWADPFEIPWTAFLSDDSEYFINGILYLRLDLTITTNSQT